MQQTPPPPAPTPSFLKPSRYGLTLANGVTAIRLVLVPFIAEALFAARYDMAFGLTLIAGLSDAVDGVIARYYSAKSIVGAYLDPIADKILILTLFGILTYQGHLPLWLMVLALARDVAIVVTVAIFTRMKKTGLRMKPLFVSKLTTFSQIVLLLTTLADLGFALGLADVLSAIVWITAALTVLSWVMYFFEGLRAVRAVEPAHVP